MGAFRRNKRPTRLQLSHYTRSRRASAGTVAVVREIGGRMTERQDCASAVRVKRRSKTGNDTSMTSNKQCAEKLLFSATDLAKLPGISRSSVWALHFSGRIPLPVRLGRRTFRRMEEIRRWVDADCPSRERWKTDKSPREGVLIILPTM